MGVASCGIVPTISLYGSVPAASGIGQRNQACGDSMPLTPCCLTPAVAEATRQEKRFSRIGVRDRDKGTG